jgi:kynurenine formamidase
MSKIIDLTGPLYNGMWSYNELSTLGVGLPDFRVEQLAAIPDQGFEAFGYVTSSISGTYIENAGHMLGGIPSLNSLDVSAFIRPAVVCHLPRKGPDEVIHGAELAANCPPIQRGDALLIECGWGARWEASDYVLHGPGYHPDCLAWFLDQPFSILGVDVPCIETARSRPNGTEAAGNMLVPLFERGILLLAPLVNLDRIQISRGELIALPLNIRGVSGAPCRAIFREC